jgi:hypothetical protein
MKEAIRKLVEEAGLRFEEFDGGETPSYGGRRGEDGLVVRGSTVREVSRSIADLRRRDERRFVKQAVEGAGLRFSTFEKSIRENGEPVGSIVYRGWNDEGEEVVSGSCLGDVLEAVEKFREAETLRIEEMKERDRKWLLRLKISRKTPLGLTEGNVDAGHFFRWLKEHARHFDDSAADRINWLRMFESELLPCGSNEFTLPADAAKGGKEISYTDFEFKRITNKDGEEGYAFVHGESSQETEILEHGRRLSESKEVHEHGQD